MYSLNLSILLQQTTPPGGGMMSSLLLFAGMFVVLYFFMIRPQMKRQKDQKNRIAGMKVGDNVRTSGGIVGVIAEVQDAHFVVEVENNVRLKIYKPFVDLDAIPVAPNAQ